MRRVGAISLWALACLVPAEAGASTFAVSPTRIELTPVAPNAMLTVTNTSSRAVRFQLSAFTWDQRPDGLMVLNNTSAVVFYPPLLEVGPGQSRRVRVGTTARFDAVEQTFRIFIEELPDLSEGEQGLGIRVRARMGVPVFVSAAREAGSAAIEAAQAEKRTVSFVLRNTGPVHLVPTSVRIVGLSQTGEPSFEQPVQAWYLLARHSLALSTPIDTARCAEAATLLLDAQFENGHVSQRMPVPQGFCAR